MSEDIKVTDGTVLEALNGKVDLDGGNYVGSPLEEYIHEHCGGANKVDRSELEEVQVITETYVNGTSWYRIWSDGWCEQGGDCITNSSWTTYSLLKPYKDMNYSIFVQFLHGANSTYSTNPACVAKISASEFQAGISGGKDSWKGNWQACGYIN